MRTINCLLKEKDFYDILDLHTKSTRFSEDFFKLYLEFANNYLEKNYTLISGTREHIKSEFYNICCLATWRSKDTILSFLDICRKNCDTTYTTTTGLYLPALLSFGMALILTYLMDLSKNSFINDNLPNDQKIFQYLVAFIIAVIIGMPTFIFIYTITPKKYMDKGTYAHLVLKEFLDLCEASIE